MEENKNAVETKVEFFGGKIGPWISIGLLVIGMFVAVLTNYTDFWVYNLLTLGAIICSFFLLKNKKIFGDIAVRGLQDSMLAILIIAFMLAGILSKVLRGSGLVESLVWLSGVMKLDSGFIPVISFIICCLISTACGTSSGSIVAVLPIMLPIGTEMGCNPALVTGAVISGALFGDNLAPISDTTIASALTQESNIRDVVKTRLPYSLIAGGISAVLFIIFGKLTTDATAINIATNEANPIALVLLLVPILMIILMKLGWDLGGTLIVCDVLAILLTLVLGLMPASTMFSGDGPIINGINGMLNMIVFCILFFIVIQAIKESGAMEKLGSGIAKRCKTARSAELVIMFFSVFGTVVTAGSSTGIVFAGPIANDVRKEFKIPGARAANLLDAIACATCGFCPICTPFLLAFSMGPELIGEAASKLTYTGLLQYMFHPIFLVLVFVISAITGIGRKLDD